MLDSIDTSIYNLLSISLPKPQRPVLCGVYLITNPSGNVYIGESKDILSRWIFYKRKDCVSQKRLYNSFVSHSPENHTFEIIELCDFESLLERERFWQDHYIDQGFILGKSLMNLILTSTNKRKRIYSTESYDRLMGENNPNYGNTGSKIHFTIKEDSYDKLIIKLVNL